MGYTKSAMYYDLFGEKNDVEYYKNLGVKCGSALEIGVGTARVALELARAGVEVWGIDNSEEMLAIASKKAAAEPEVIQKRLHLHLQDMVDFHFERKFPLIYIPSSGFGHCESTEAQLNCLKCISNHLESKGLLVLDIHLPQGSYQSGLRLIDKKEVDSKLILRWISNRVAAADQLLHTTLIYEVYEHQTLTERIVESSTVSLIYKRELLLLLATYFAVENVYGDFSKGEEVRDLMVVEARKP